MEPIKVTFRKPIYSTASGDFCYVRDVYINQALKENRPLQITSPNGVWTGTAQEWMKNSKRMDKVYKRPNEPMILYGNYVPKV